MIFDSTKAAVCALQARHRGMIYFHLTLRTDERDLHSGIFGGDALYQREGTASLVRSLPNRSRTRSLRLLVATGLTNVINRDTTIAAAGDSVKLPAVAPGMSITVANAAAVNALAIFPATGDAINGPAANAALVPNLSGNKTATSTSAVAGVWHAVVGAPSSIGCSASCPRPVLRA